MNLPVLNGSNVLTHSRMQCYKTCPRKHYLRYELGLRPERSSTPLRFGSAFHVGLDLRAQGMSAEESCSVAVAGYEILPDWCNNDELIYNWKIERETVQTLLNTYFWYWENATVPPNLAPQEIIETEKVFEAQILNPDSRGSSRTFVVSGKRDKLVRLVDGRLAIMEHKTTSDSLESTSDYWRRLKIDQQISLYMLAAKDQGIDVETVLYDVVRKPTIKPCMVPLRDEEGIKIVLNAAGERVRNRDGKSWRQTGDVDLGYFLQQRRETPQEWSDRLAQDIAARPEWYFARQEIPRVSSDLDEFRRELWQQAQDIGNARKSGLWYRNAGACTGMYRCEYFDLCTSNADVSGDVPGFERVTELHPELAGEE